MCAAECALQRPDALYVEFDTAAAVGQGLRVHSSATGTALLVAPLSV
jgi:hypothetical protein